jgi:hypothetical protein
MGATPLYQMDISSTTILSAIETKENAVLSKHFKFFLCKLNAKHVHQDEAGLLNKSSCSAPALDVNNVIVAKDMTLAILYCAT